MLFDLDKFFTFDMENTGIGRVNDFNLIKTANGYLLQFALPGYEEYEIDVYVENGSLKVSALKEDNDDDEIIEYMRKGFVVNSYKNSFKIPSGFDEDSIDASYKNGLLSVYLIKSDMDNTVKKISIKT